MKKWLTEHKKAIFLSTVMTLLPILIGCILWNQLPASMTIHWNAVGTEDGFAGKAFAVFGIPVILAALNLLCIVFTAADPKQREQNKKALAIIFWIMPIISLAVCSVMYSVSMGNSVKISMAVFPLIGIALIVTGNYMPKVKQNSTLGLKISWTLRNEENWNNTHRFAGKLWVAAGVVMLPAVLLPLKWVIPVLLILIAILVLVPMIYSFRIYKAHQAQGIVYAASTGDKKYRAIGIVAVLVIAVIVAVLMLTGEISYTFGEKSLQLEADYSADLEISYADVDEVELRDTFDAGFRTMGFSSARLLLGSFQNDEFQDYTLYAYTTCDSMILIRSGDKYLALNARTEEETQKRYETLLEKLEQ